jgi:hypothetical protein
MDGWYLTVWIPLAFALTVIRSYRSGSATFEDTHQVSQVLTICITMFPEILINSFLTTQDYFMHTDTVKDPFSTIVGIFYSSTNQFRSLSHPKPPHDTSNSPEDKPLATTLPPTTQQVADTTSQFQKALAASLQTDRKTGSV